MTVVKPSATGGKSCASCPSFLADNKQRQTMGSNIGGPICGIKMLPLLAPNQPKDTQNRALAFNASDCDQYGVEVNFETKDSRYTPDLIVGADSQAMLAESDDQRNARCGDCVHYVSSGEVSEHSGWTASLCRASGSLMPDDRLQNYASKCGRFKMRVGPRSRRGNLGFFIFFKQFGPDFGKVNVVAEYRKALSNSMDPGAHPTDREVTAAHKARGIKSWRKIVDPEGYGAPTYLPVYEVLSFPEELRVLVPKTGDDEHPEMYADHNGFLYTIAVMWQELNETPAWWGQGGVGKTEFARFLAWLMQSPFNRLNITSSTDLDDLVGKMRFEGGETVYQYGRLPKAWKSPGVLLLDEPNTGPPDVWQVLRPLTDNSRMLVLDQNRGERIPRGPDTYLAMAMNPAWDPRNVGTNSIGDADNSRLMHMFFSLPPKDLEVEIIQKRVGLDGWQLSAQQAKALMGVAEDLRGQGDALHTTWGIRHQIKAARALRWFSPPVAYRRAVGDSLEPSQLELILTSVNSHFAER